ncbi:hypothetical protein G9A89_021398 [Geosiphon pyriformis]|nr:hypothetical protein G9A89_021398 [Geosiphon pyriformis]
MANESSKDALDTLTEETANVPFFKKKGRVSKSIRKRPKKTSSSNDDSEEEVTTEIVRKERKETSSPFVQETKRTKRVIDEISVKYASNKSAASMPQDVATRTAEWDTETDRDAQALLEKKLAAEEAGEDNFYKGQHAYKSYIKKRDTAAGSAASSKIKAGPIRAPANIRVTSRFDYQPDICKDYKETGYCGYGDSCKFLHDRGDYKTGWQLEREWEEKQGKLGHDPNAYLVESNEDSDDDLPFACLICREEFKSPVVTKCGHYYCEKCALQNYSQNPKCFACGAPTNGIFNSAKVLLQKLKEKKGRTVKKSDTDEKQTSDKKKSESDDDDDSD